MSRNGSGTYTLPAGNPVVSGTSITTTWANTTLTDIANTLTASVAADGQTPMTGALNMANNKITSLGTPTLSTDAVTKAYADALTNGTVAGSFTDLIYTSTLTGGTGIVNLGSGQFYKDASGNVGIGTASPASTKLHSYQTSGSTIAGLFQTNQTDAFATFQGSTTSALTTVRIGATGDNLVAYAGGSERMRIDSSGNLLVGTTTTSIAGTTLAGKGIGQSADYSGTYAQAINSSSTTGNQLFVAFGRGGSSCGYIISTGTNSTSFGTSSDYRLKENIAPMTGALAKVSALKPVTYNWKEDGTASQGFIAHELQEICPEAVVGEKDAVRMQRYEISPAIPAEIDEDGKTIKEAVEAVMGEREVPAYQGIDTSFLVATLTAAIQELKSIVDAQAERIAILEAK
jgi:hypothetical protein